jgi:hypothetical protein
MKLRATILVVSLLPLGAATSALAVTKPAAKPVCNIIKDASGDAEYNGAVPGDGNDDIVSADVASDGKKITAVLRLAALAQPDPMAPLGQGFFVEFGAKGSDSNLFLSARTYPTGTKYVFGYSAPDPNTGINTSYTIGDATGSIDTAKKQVRITAVNSAFAPAGSKLTKGTKLLVPTATTYRIAGQGLVPSQSVAGTRVPIGGLLLPFDDASGKTYTVGTLSCVKPG